MLTITSHTDSPPGTHFLANPKLFFWKVVKLVVLIPVVPNILRLGGTIILTTLPKPQPLSMYPEAVELGAWHEPGQASDLKGWGYLEGQGDLVSRLIIRITRVTIWVMGGY